MTEHTSEAFKEILRGAGWSDEDIENGETLAIAREVRDLKKEGITEASAAAEGGGVVGADPGSSGDAETLAVELERLQGLPKNAKNYAARKKVREALDKAAPMRVEVS